MNCGLTSPCTSTKTSCSCRCLSEPAEVVCAPSPCTSRPPSVRQGNTLYATEMLYRQTILSARVPWRFLKMEWCRPSLVSVHQIGNISFLFSCCSACCNSSVLTEPPPQAKGILLGLTFRVTARWSRQMQMWRHWPTVTCSTSVWEPWGRSSSCTQSMAAGSALTSITTSPTTWGRAVKLT